MPAGKNTKSVQAYIPADMEQRLIALAAHRGQTISVAAGDAVRDAVLEFEHDDTNRSKIKRIEAAQKRIEDKMNMVMLLAFAQNGGEVIKLTREDVQRLRDLIAELTA